MKVLAHKTPDYNSYYIFLDKNILRFYFEMNELNDVVLMSKKEAHDELDFYSKDADSKISNLDNYDKYKRDFIKWLFEIKQIFHIYRRK